MLIRITPQATPDQARQNLASFVAQTRADLAGLSRMLGRAPGYLGRYVREGKPQLLAAEDQRELARFLGVQPQALGAAIPEPEGEAPPAYLKPPLRRKR